MAQPLPSDTMNIEADAFSPYATIRYTYDSNLYRLDDDAPDIGDREDNLIMLAVGAKSDIASGQQRYKASAEVNHTFFEAHDDLDYTGGRASALWNWTSPYDSNGTLSYGYQRSLRDFANESGLERVKDIRTEHAVDATANFDLPGALRLGLRGELADIAFDPSERLDLQRVMAGVNLGFASATGSVIGFDAEFVQGRYDTNPNADFVEITVGPTLDWRPTELTQLDARIGYTKRDNDSKLRADYDDVTGEVALRFDNKSGRKLAARVYRDISNLGDEVAEYALVTGVSVEPSWRLTGALDLRVRAAYEERDFQATREVTDRKDEIVAAGAFVDWNVRRNVTVTFGGDLQSRSSTRALQDYDFGRVQLQAMARF
jgi:hypothetical protein